MSKDMHRRAVLLAISIMGCSGSGGSDREGGHADERGDARDRVGLRAERQQAQRE